MQFSKTRVQSRPWKKKYMCCRALLMCWTVYSNSNIWDCKTCASYQGCPWRKKQMQERNRVFSTRYPWNNIFSPIDEHNQDIISQNYGTFLFFTKGQRRPPPSSYLLVAPLKWFEYCRLQSEIYCVLFCNMK